MDTKMQGPGCITKAEKDNEQILWLAGVAVQFLAVHSLVVPSYAANHPQVSLQSFVLSCNRPQPRWRENYYKTVSSLLRTKSTVNISKCIMTMEEKQTEILT